MLPALALAREDCPPDKGVALQVLGSGGPIADDGRASSGYLVWVDGRSRALIDAGGGVFLRFGEAGASFTDLDVIALSHLHTDHSAALPALLKSGYFSGRERPLVLAGPSGGGPFPGLETFVGAMIGPVGAYPYLGGYIEGTGRLPRLDVREVDIADTQRVTPVDLGDSAALALTAQAAPHGIVPALAFRVEAEERSLVFATDQTASNPAFTDFAADTDILVMHLVIPEAADPVARRLHATPGRVGVVAGDVAPGLLVLSHFMARSLRDLEANVAHVRQGYKGKLALAEDLACYVVN